MGKLLKLDLYRLRKEKAPLVGILVSVGILILSVIVFSIQGYHAQIVLMTMIYSLVQMKYFCKHLLLHQIFLLFFIL